MIEVSYTSVAWMLGVLSIFVTLVTNIWRLGQEKLAVKPKTLLHGEEADRRAVAIRASLVGVILAVLMHANIFDMLKHPEDPAAFFSWSNSKFCKSPLFGRDPNIVDKWVCNKGRQDQDREVEKEARNGQENQRDENVHDFDWGAVPYEAVGVLVTGMVLGFLSRLWNDLFDILYALKFGLQRRVGISELRRNQREPEDSHESSE